MVLTLNELFERLEEGYAGLSRFAADASHELRTPLAIISSELEIALRRPRTVAEWESSARITLDEVQRLTRIVERLLELARSDSDALVEGAPTDLVALVEQVLGAFQRRAEDAGVSLPAVPDAPDRALWVNADADAIATAVSNLVSNALRVTPRGGAVRARIESKPAGRVALHVDDDGPGLASNERETIFEPFVRGASTPRARAGSAEDGLGLGLAITRRIVERHSGTIHAAASASGGARFTIELPLYVPPPVE